MTTAYSSRYPTPLCATLGKSKYTVKKRLTYQNWAAITPNLNILEGYLTLRNVIKWTLSFSASSKSVWIHPWSLFIFLKDPKCLIIAPTNPGTPATVSKKRILFIQILSLTSLLYHGKIALYPLITSKPSLNELIK